MAIEARCAKCSKKLKVKDELAGKKIKCPECGAIVAIPAPAAGKQELNPDLNSTESIINLNLKKFKNQAIDEDDEDLNLDELEGAVVNRKKREQQVKAGPPSEPLQPIDWVLCLLFGGFCCVWPFMLMYQGKNSRGKKALLLAGGVQLFFIIVGVLFGVALSMVQK